MSCGYYRICIYSPSATLVTSKLHPLLLLVFHCCFNTYIAERLAGGISLYQLLSDWLHRAGRIRTRYLYRTRGPPLYPLGHCSGLSDLIFCFYTMNILQDVKHKGLHPWILCLRDVKLLWSFFNFYLKTKFSCSTQRRCPIQSEIY